MANRQELEELRALHPKWDLDNLIRLLRIFQAEPRHGVWVEVLFEGACSECRREWGEHSFHTLTNAFRCPDPEGEHES